MTRPDTTERPSGPHPRLWGWLIISLCAMLGAGSGAAFAGWAGLIPGFLFGWVAVLLVSSIGFLVFVLRMPRVDKEGQQ